MLNQSTTEDTLFLEQLHFYGLSIRFSRNLMKTLSADKAIQLSKEYLSSLNLSGFISFLEGQSRSTQRFGYHNGKALKNHFEAVKRCAQCNDKLCIEDDFVIVKSPLTFILISRHNLDHHKVDMLQDILAVFIDTVDAWLESYLTRTDLSQVLQNSLVNLIESSRDLINCHNAASDELLSAMITKFPVLGLEPDQEEMILDIIQYALKKHIELIENQIAKNNVLGDILIASVDALNNSDQYQHDEPEEGDNCVELF